MTTTSLTLSALHSLFIYRKIFDLVHVIHKLEKVEKSWNRFIKNLSID